MLKSHYYVAWGVCSEAGCGCLVKNNADDLGPTDSSDAFIAQNRRRKLILLRGGALCLTRMDNRDSERLVFLLSNDGKVISRREAVVG